MILIVAGTVLEARHYAEAFHLARGKYRIITYPEQVYGIREPEVHWVGTYYARNDIHRLIQILDAAARPGQPKHVYPK